MNKKVKGRTLWFFGLPASGKSTLAKCVVGDSPGFVLLDGDEVRQTVVNFNMDQSARLLHLSYMAFCCRQLNECGINVAAAFVTPLRSHRTRITEILPDVKFIWLRCALETCAARDPKGHWKKAASGNMPHLTGAGGEWEEPTACAMTIQTDVMSVKEAYSRIKERFGVGITGTT
jgi:adenylylsulfate kinase-like enzyme